MSQCIDGAARPAETQSRLRLSAKRKELLSWHRRFHPAFRETVRTYLPMLSSRRSNFADRYQIRTVDINALSAAAANDTGCVIVQQPPCLRRHENLKAIAGRLTPKTLLMVTSTPSPSACWRRRARAVSIYGGRRRDGDWAVRPAPAARSWELFILPRKRVRHAAQRCASSAERSILRAPGNVTLRAANRTSGATRQRQHLHESALFALAATVYLSSMERSRD